jgi:hypothetical protein
MNSIEFDKVYHVSMALLVIFLITYNLWNTTVWGILALGFNIGLWLGYSLSKGFMI